MAKWIAAALGVVVIALLVLLRSEVLSPAENAAPAPPAKIDAPRPPTRVAEIPAALRPTPTAAPADGKPAKLDPQSDEFFFQFDEVVPANLTRAAARCYEGARRVHRNKKLKLAFKTHIKDGEVTVTDVKVLESTLDYPNLEACFVREVEQAHWHNDALPDYDTDDQLVIRPERGMKKYWQDNLDYEGDGPIGPAVMTPGQAPPPSDSASATAAADW